MKTFKILVTFFILILFSAACFADSETARDLLGIDNLKHLQEEKSNGRLDIKDSGKSQLEPVVSLDYFSKQFENPLYSKTHHLISANTGIRFSLLENLDLTGSAKLPFLKAETNSNELTPSGRLTGETSIKNDIGSNSLQNLGWYGDINIKLGKKLNLNLFYDYTKRIPGWGGETLQEEKIGSKLEIKFK